MGSLLELILVGFLVFVLAVGIYQSRSKDGATSAPPSKIPVGQSDPTVECPGCGHSCPVSAAFCERCDYPLFFSPGAARRWGDRPIIPVHGANPGQPAGSTGGQSPDPGGARRGASRPNQGQLSIARVAETYRAEGDPKAEGLPVSRIFISGAVHAPHEAFPATVRLNLIDITEGDERGQPHAVLTDADAYRNEEGVFELGHDFLIPYRTWVLNKMHVGVIPDFTLQLPKRGRRRVRLFAFVTPRHQRDKVLFAGILDYDVDFDQVGYLEWEKHEREQEEHLARVFVASSSVDGAIGNAEIETIKQFFAARYERYEDSTQWKSRASAVLRASVEDLAHKRTTPGRLLNEAAKAIRDAKDPEIARAAYEVAVRAVAADGTVKQKEEQLLEKLATALGLEGGVVQELRDRILRASMFEHAEDESILGMPQGLSEDAKRSWLSAEYGKWRGRVSHSDPDIAAEATDRLERIAKLRTSLGR